MSNLRENDKIAVIALTQGGCRTALRLSGLPADVYLKAGAAASGHTADAHIFDCPLAELLAEIFPRYGAFVMVMATGIAVRQFAPYVRHKTCDPAVLVVDEQANFVISLLSGHLGGGNALCRRAAELLAATPVITTATDVTNKPAFDLLAQANHCAIANIAALKYISGALVNGKQAAVLSEIPLAEPLPPDICRAENAANAGDLVYIGYQTELPAAAARFDHVLRLVPQNLVLGVGCKRNTPAEALRQALDEFLAAHGIDPLALQAIASIDLKADEPGLLALAQELKLPFRTFSAAELAGVSAQMAADGKSAFVAGVTGTPSVAQAAARLSSGGETVVPKEIYPGITFSLAAAPMVFRWQ